MNSRTRVEDLEPLSPELVLVASPELAQEARDQLSSPAPVVAGPEPDEHGAAPAHEVSIEPPRPMPPPYPRPAIVQPAPEPERRRRPIRTVAVVVAVAALAAAGAVAALAWGHFLSAPKDTQASLLPPSEARVTAPGATRAPAGTASVPAPPGPRKAPEGKPRKSTGSKPPGPAGKGVFVPARTWAWSSSKGASAYFVRFFRNGREVFRARTAKTRLVLPPSFRYVAGRYRWTVRPATGPPSKRRYGRAIVDSRFVVTPAVAVQANRG